MESSSSASRSAPSNTKTQDATKSKPAHRGGSRYKEKYQALREKFDQVNAEHEEFERQLEQANARIRKLQAENDLLLDAISITVPATPSLLRLIHPSPTPVTPAPPSTHVHPQQQANQSPHHHMNGHAYHPNGRYRERESERLERRDLTPHGHEPTTNGHPS